MYLINPSGNGNVYTTKILLEGLQMDRKILVKKLGEHFGVEPRYMGVPSFAYEIETEEGTLIIDRAGNTTLEGVEVKFTINEDDKITREVQGQVENEFEVALPFQDHSGATLRNIINMIASKQPLIKKAFNLEENIVEDSFVIGINEVKIETLEECKNVIEDIGARGCVGIAFDFYERKVVFKFYQREEKREAYIQMVSLLNRHAQLQKYASAKCKATDNEKFALRTWLIRLGMVGNEYKEARKILLENMDGNGAFRYGRPEIESGTDE